MSRCWCAHGEVAATGGGENDGNGASGMVALTTTMLPGSTIVMAKLVRIG